MRFMVTNYKPSHPPRGQTGVSLVQLMVALTLGAIITIGLMEILVSSRGTHRTQEAQARMQETGRFSTEMLGYEVRMAGHMGCPNLDRVSPRVIANPAPANPFTASTFLQTYESGSSAWTPSLPAALSTATLGSDAVTVHRGGDCSAVLGAAMSSDSANLTLAAGHACEFNSGDTLIISDCVNADIFQATNVSNSGGIDTISHATTGNTSNRFTKAYGTDALVLKLQSTSFFIAPGASGLPALWRQRDSDAAEELVEGVERLQIIYGEDTGNDLTADRYVLSTATGFDVANVVGVRLNLLLQTPETNVTVTPQTYTFDGTTTTAADGRLRRVYSTTVNLRNRTIL